MTTDTRPKLAYEECKIGNKIVKISGIAKGSGMIAPNMATMLSFIFTDANIPSAFLKAILKKVSATTFNSITVDSDTSTNDMVGIFSTKTQRSRISRNPKTGGKVFTPEKKTINFKMAKFLFKKLNNEKE